MPEIIFGILVLALLLWASNAFSSVDPRKLAPVVKFAGGFGALGGAAFLAARGQFQLAVPLGFAGLGLLGWLPGKFAGFGGGAFSDAAARPAFSTIFSLPRLMRGCCRSPDACATVSSGSIPAIQGATFG